MHDKNLIQELYAQIHQLPEPLLFTEFGFYLKKKEEEI